MIRSTSVGVKGVARPASESPRQIQFAFRADPVALDAMKLPGNARQVFGLVLDNARSRGGRCRLSNATMAAILGCSTPTIKRALAALEAAHLVRRETAAEGRIRLAIVVTWDGVDQSRSTVQAGVDQSRSGGGSMPIQGVDQSRSTNQSPHQSDHQTGPILSTGEGEDAEQAALYAALGPAKYLQAMIAKGKAEADADARSGGKPVPPPLPCPVPPAPVEAPKPPTGASPGKAPVVPHDDASREVGRMVRDLGQALKAETVGTRRVGPAKLARQLAEMRRRHAKGDPVHREPSAQSRGECGSFRPSGSP